MSVTSSRCGHRSENIDQMLPSLLGRLGACTRQRRAPLSVQGRAYCLPEQELHHEVS